MKRLYLASGSPRRMALLEDAGIDFIPLPVDVVEDQGAGVEPRELVKANALRKAMAGTRKLDEMGRNGVVLAADTVVALDGRVFGKPPGPREAGRVLSELSGRDHMVYTGFALVDQAGGDAVADHAETRVFFRTLEASEIEEYVASGEPLDKAGAYGIQGRGALLVERISGCYFNVVGLPLSRVWMALKRMGCR